MTTVSGASKARTAAILRCRRSGSSVGSMMALGRMSSDEPPEWRSRKASPMRQDMIGDIGRNLLGDRALRIAGKGAVEVESVDRRRAAPSHHGMDVVRRHEDEPTLNFAGIEFADQLADRDRALILVAVIAAFEDDGRARAVRDHGDRHARDAPCIVMWRMRESSRSRSAFRACRSRPSRRRWTAGLPQDVSHDHSSLRAQIGADQSAGERRACGNAFGNDSQKPLALVGRWRHLHRRSRR